MELVDISSPRKDSLNSEKIKLLLQTESTKYTVIKKKSSTASSSSLPSWWSSFGYPAKSDENAKYQRIFGYVSCFKCYQTFIYSAKSGTTRLREHQNKCARIISLSSSSSSSSINIDQSNISSSSSSILIDHSIDTASSIQSTLPQHGFRTSLKLSETDTNNMKTLCAQWVCMDLRPFSMLDDSGFRAVAQELIRIGHKYGMIDVNEILRSRHTIARSINDIAATYREHMKQKLIEPLKYRAITICPDFWTDTYKNISYLGLNLTYVDAHYQFFSIDLFCRPFMGVKSGDLIVKKKKTTDPILTIDISISSNNNTLPQAHKDAVSSFNDGLSSEEESGDDEEDVLPSLPMVRKRKTNDKEPLLSKKPVEDIPRAAKTILLTIKQCKKMVKFIKQSGSNKDIENLGGTTVHQAIDIRWISIIDSLQSILKSFKVIKKILIYKQQHKLIMNIDEKTIKQILLLLKPFRDVIKLIQTGNSPSLYMVLLCFQTLKDVMSSYQSLLDYDKVHGGDESKEDVDETDEDILDELEGKDTKRNSMSRRLF
ncbi:unnamed protein product [Rotaria sp. Silwood2]|nr:unnamed protein product [Rotaria sp. Silwood2]CAF4026025.1 unnamed protein product [Rotaria sp. Silwood2]